MTHQQPATARRTWLLVSDLDGTLLDDAYDLEAAAAAVDAQAAQGRHVALASSKTCDEMLNLARLCRTRPVLIFENGAGIAWPQTRAGAGEVPYSMEIAGEGYPALRRRLRQLRRRRGYRFVGFGDLSAREVADATGLSPDAARLARHRQASEPLLWQDTEERLHAFRAALEAVGYRLVRGGRFLHAMPATDKAHGLARVAERLGGVRVVACGDADNDLGMLRAAELAVVFPRRGGGYLTVPDADGGDVAVRAESAGAECWNRTLNRLLDTEPDPPRAPGPQAAASGTPHHGQGGQP